MFTARNDAVQFLLAGNARLTVVSQATEVRFTFRVRRPAGDKPWFVQVLTGSDNEGDYTFFGTIFTDWTFRHSPRAAIGPDAPSAKAFAWLWRHLSNPILETVPKGVDLHHEGRCGRCGRALTVPESIESGFGPECAGKIGL